VDKELLVLTDEQPKINLENFAADITRKLESLNTKREEIEKDIAFLGSDPSDSVRQDEKNISTLNKMWSKFKSVSELIDQQMKVRVASDTTNYCFFLNINTFF